MRKERTLNIAKALAAQLHATEEAIDTALGEAAHLIDAYITSRRALRMSTTVPGDVYENTLKAMAALNLAQQHMTTAHSGLERIRGQLGIEAVVDPFEKGRESPTVPSGVINHDHQATLTV